MSADPAHRRQLGELLVEKGVLTDAQLQEALAEQQQTGSPLGEILVRLGFSHAPTIGNALAEQHGGPLRTEYGLALGPTSGIGMPLEPTEPALDKNIKDDGLVTDLLRSAGPAGDEDAAIASLTAALDERTEELDRVRVSLAAVEQRGADLAAVRAEVGRLERELAEAREERTSDQPSRELHQAELAAATAELSNERQERAELEHQLEQAQVRQAQATDALQALRLAQERQRAELAATKAELIDAHQAQALLEQQLERAKARSDQTSDTQQTLRELRIAQERQRGELTAANASLSTTRQERAELELEFEQVRALQAEATDALQALRLAHERQRAELAATKAELTDAHQAQALLEQQLERTKARSDQTSDAQQVLHELRLAQERQQGELTATNATLTNVRQERAELERQLEHAQAGQARATDALQALRLAHERQRAELAATKAELTDAHQARARLERDAGANARQDGTVEPDHALHMLALAEERARAGEHTEATVTHHTVRDLELTLAQHKAELAAMRAEFTKLDEERTHHADRADELEEQLERIRAVPTQSAGDHRALQEQQQALVAAARARAQRRYGPPLRADFIQEQGGTHEPRSPVETLGDGESVANAGGSHGITIRLWQLAMFGVLVPALLYVLVPIDPFLATAAVVLLAVVLVANGWRTGRGEKAGSAPF